MNSAVSHSAPASPAHWIDARALAASDAPRHLQGWLLWQGLLTDALREACPEEFRLQVLRQVMTPLDDVTRALLKVVDERALCREIAMGDQTRSYVFARTLLPTTTLSAHPWLAALGESSLGEQLRQVEGLSRGPFEYAQLTPGDAQLAGVVVALGRPVWARRSVFRLSGAPLCVFEAFLPDIGGCRSPGGA